MKASTLLLLGALGAFTAACATETRVIQGSPDPSLPAPPDGVTGAPPSRRRRGHRAGLGGRRAGSEDGGTNAKDAGDSDAQTPPRPQPPNADLGRVHCSASGGAAFYCPAGNVCCVQNAVKQLAPIAFSCETFNGCKSRPDPLPLNCDGPEDCKTGQHCFAIVTPAVALTSLCTTTPLSPEWKRLCNPGASGECAAGETCVATTSGPAVGVCR